MFGGRNQDQWESLSEIIANVEIRLILERHIVCLRARFILNPPLSDINLVCVHISHNLSNKCHSERKDFIWKTHK